MQGMTEWVTSSLELKGVVKLSRNLLNKLFSLSLWILPHVHNFCIRTFKHLPSSREHNAYFSCSNCSFSLIFVRKHEVPCSTLLYCNVIFDILHHKHKCRGPSDSDFSVIFNFIHTICTCTAKPQEDDDLLILLIQAAVFEWKSIFGGVLFQDSSCFSQQSQSHTADVNKLCVTVLI